MSLANRGRFVWYQLQTPDPPAAREFYTQLIGWGTEDWQGPEGTYPMVTHAGRAIAGILQLPPDAEAPPHWLGYVEVADVERTTARAEAQGARTLVPAIDMPEVGRFAVLGDPQGAAFAVFTPANEEPVVGPPEPGLVSWHELATSDPEAALAFYGDLFGWHGLTAHDMGEYGVYREYGRPADGYPLGGIYTQRAEDPGPPAFLFYIQVPDADAGAERVRELGGQVVNGPMDVPGGDRVVQCTDPQGAFFALHSV